MTAAASATGSLTSVVSGVSVVSDSASAGVSVSVSSVTFSLSRLTTSAGVFSSLSAKTEVAGRIDEKESTANRTPKRDNTKRFNSGNFVFINGD